MKFKIVYTDETEEIKDFDCYQDCAEYCYLEGDHVLYFVHLDEA